jgi:hypothetical protein
VSELHAKATAFFNRLRHENRSFVDAVQHLSALQRDFLVRYPELFSEFHDRHWQSKTDLCIVSAKDIDGPKLSDWMDKVPATAFNSITLPGTHDSAAYDLHTTEFNKKRPLL